MHFFDRDNAEGLEVYLRDRFPDRPFRVHPGDCNDRIYAVLNELRQTGIAWAPSFAFIDPDGPDYKWRTLKALSEFKQGSGTKVELWMLFPEGMFVRFLRTDGGEVDPAHVGRITDMYGTEDWRRVYKARLSDQLTPAEARVKYVNLMRWRLENVLEYRWTHTLEVHNEQGNPIYHLIFATDHKGGNRIMTHLYRKAREEFPAMRQHAIDSRTGAQRLFDEEYIQVPHYEHKPPWDPSSFRRPQS